MNPTPLSNSGHSSAQRMRAYLIELQARITSAIEGVEGQRGARFLVDPWRKEAHEPLQGEGVTCILEGGRIFERAGVGFSHVQGPSLPPSIGRNWRVRLLRPWGCHWCFTRSILTCQRCT